MCHRYVQSDADEAFAFDRTLSRLSEMGSEMYQRSAHSPLAGGPEDSAAGADFLLTFESQALSSTDIDALWERYAGPAGRDVLDGSGMMQLLEDLSLLRSALPPMPMRPQPPLRRHAAAIAYEKTPVTVMQVGAPQCAIGGSGDRLGDDRHRW